MGFVFKSSIATFLLALACISSSSAEVAVLRNGFSIRADRHESRETMTRLYFAESSKYYVEVPTEQIARFEADDPPPAPVLKASPATTLDEVVNAASSSNHLDPDLVMSLIGTESGFNVRAVSPKGAQGLMQLMPQTASRLGVVNPMDPVANVEGGTRYLRELLDLYHHDLAKALAAYNAGPERVDQYRGVPPYRETQAYVAKVIGEFRRKKFSQAPTLYQAKSKPRVLGNLKPVAAVAPAQPSLGPATGSPRKEP
jgi:soluble lytic murein transglycosylase-like protein